MERTIDVAGYLSERLNSPIDPPSLMHDVKGEKVRDRARRVSESKKSRRCEARRDKETHRRPERLLLIPNEVLETCDDSLILDGSNGDVGSDGGEERIRREPFPVPSSQRRSTKRTPSYRTEMSVDLRRNRRVSSLEKEWEHEGYDRLTPLALNSRPIPFPLSSMRSRSQVAAVV